MAGPTGVGKSAFSVELAEALGGEIIGADAFQIYSGLPILTAQPSRSLKERIPHHLIGVLDPGEICTAARYAEMAQKCIDAVRSRGKIPILTGGTGLYLKALTHGLADLPQIDPALRARIAQMDVPEALARLREADCEAPDQIDARNPVRIRRALEIVLSTGRPFRESRGTWSAASSDFDGVLLTRDRGDLRLRIAENVDAMFDEGVIEEVRRAGDVGPGAARAIGYDEIRRLLSGDLSLHACRAAIFTATRRYSKRQMTWFRHQFPFPSIDLSSTSSTPAELVRKLAAGQPVRQEA